MEHTNYNSNVNLIFRDNGYRLLLISFLMKIEKDLFNFNLEDHTNIGFIFNKEFTIKLCSSSRITNEVLETIDFSIIDIISQNEEVKKIIQDYINILDINYQIKEDDNCRLLQSYLKFLIIRQFDIWNKIELASISDNEELIKMRNIELDKINKLNTFIEKYEIQNFNIDWMQLLNLIILEIEKCNNKKQVIIEFINFFKCLN